MRLTKMTLGLYYAKKAYFRHNVVSLCAYITHPAIVSSYSLYCCLIWSTSSLPVSYTHLSHCDPVGTRTPNRADPAILPRGGSSMQDDARIGRVRRKRSGRGANQRLSLIHI